MKTAQKTAQQNIWQFNRTQLNDGYLDIFYYFLTQTNRFAKMSCELTFF